MERQISATKAYEIATPKISYEVRHSWSNGTASRSAPDGTIEGKSEASVAPRQETAFAIATGARHLPSTPKKAWLTQTLDGTGPLVRHARKNGRKASVDRIETYPIPARG